MLTIKDRGRIIKIQEHCNKIISKSDSISRIETLKNNNDLLDIICFNLLQIGELSNGLTKQFAFTHNEISWKDAIGMRNIIVHGYGNIRVEKIYSTIKEDIPKLYNYINQILKEDSF